MLFKLLLILVQLAEFFIVCGGRVVQNLRFDNLNARSPAKPLKDATQQAEVRQYFNDDVLQPLKSSEKNNEEPVILRPTPHEVHDRQDLHDKSPRIEEMT